MTMTAGPRAAPESMRHRLKRAFDNPLSTYYIIAGSTLLLLVIGVVMVASASSIESFRVFGSAYTLAQRQGMFAIIGVFVMFVIARTSTQFWRGLAWLLLIGSLGLLVAVLIIGVEVRGQQNWIELFGPFRLQPSEFAKFGIIVWGADLLTRKDLRIHAWSHLLVPLLPVAFLMMVLILLEGDFGNALMIAAITAGILFAAGAPLRLFAVLGGLGLVGVYLLSLAAPYRMARVMSWMDPAADRLGAGWQLTQGQYALGTGGLLGVGLGASREKWGALPEAHTDFIFPVIGEELGLAGTFFVLILVGALSFGIFRLTVRTSDPVVRLASAGVGCWIVTQAVLNIGSVLGLLPISGVPLPLVSYGGSSLLPTLAALGMLLAFARQEPGARMALRRKSTAQTKRRR